MGVPQCGMSILRNDNVVYPYYLYFRRCHVLNLRKGDVPCPPIFSPLSHVTKSYGVGGIRVFSHRGLILRIVLGLDLKSKICW